MLKVSTSILVVCILTVGGTLGAPAMGQENRGCTIIGTSGDDVLQGSEKDDVICGLGGNDAITAGAGFDTIYGGAGDDTISAGDGKGRGLDNYISDEGDKISGVENETCPE